MRKRLTASLAPNEASSAFALLRPAPLVGREEDDVQSHALVEPGAVLAHVGVVLHSGQPGIEWESLWLDFDGSVRLDVANS